MKQPPRIKLEDFFRNPEKIEFQISPDSEHISFLQEYEHRMNIFVSKRDGSDVIRLTSAKKRDIRWYQWKGNHRIIFLRDSGGDENDHVFTVDIHGENLRDLTPFDGVKAMILEMMPDSDDVLIALNKRSPELFDVYRLNTVTGDLGMVTENPGGVMGWLADHEYTVRVALANDGVNNKILYRENETTPFREILTTSFKNQFHPLQFTFDNKHIYALSNLNRDKAALVRYDLDNNIEMEVLFQHPDVDIMSLDYSRERKVLTSIGYLTDRRQREILDSKTGEIYLNLEDKFPGFFVKLISSNREETIFIVFVSNDRMRGAFYLFDSSSDDLRKLGDFNPWLNPSDLCEMKPIEYTSRDGLRINGYLTLPLNREARNLPVVINPHGGPWARDMWGFSSEVQFLANRGYAVLQMNFRGSTGYGRAFWEASFKQWGRKMQDDITDGVEWLIDQGIADPDRIAIYGASYGGYATLAGVTFTPDLYACGVDYVGVSNMFTFFESFPPYWKPFLKMVYEQVGHPEEEKEMLREISPLFHIDKIKAPLLVAQGANDPRVKKAESDQIVEALRKKGIPVEYIVKDNEGHGFSNEENRFELYRAMEAFLEKHLGGV